MTSLSICIPTYNRSTFLKELLLNIISQMNHNIKNQVEICISNNNSTDDTEYVVNEFIHDNPDICIQYSKNDQNIQAYNFVKALELAKSPYVWIIGDDDHIRDGGIDKALEAISHGADIIVSNIYHYDRTMTRDLGIVRIFDASVQDTDFDFSDRRTLKEYLLNARTKNCIGTFLSNFIFKKKNWMPEHKKKSFLDLLGSEGPQVYMHLETMLSGCKLRYISYPLINYRSNNVPESYDERYSYRHFSGLEAEGLCKVINYTVTDESIREILLELLRKDISIFRFCGYDITDEEKNFMSKFYSTEDITLFNELHNTPQDIISCYAQYKKIIFGASGTGIVLKERLAELNIDTHYFCDNDQRKHGQSLEGVSIISPLDLLRISKEDNVLVIISSMYVREIYYQLKELGIQHIKRISII